MWITFNYLNLWTTSARHNFKWVKIRIKLNYWKLSSIPVVWTTMYGCYQWLCRVWIDRVRTYKRFLVLIRNWKIQQGVRYRLTLIHWMSAVSPISHSNEHSLYIPWIYSKFHTIFYETVTIHQIKYDIYHIICQRRTLVPLGRSDLETGPGKVRDAHVLHHVHSGCHCEKTHCVFQVERPRKRDRSYHLKHWNQFI